jgi:rhodanese-related sulfurtransferase
MIRRIASGAILLALLAMPAAMYGEDLKDKADTFLKSVPVNQMYIMIARILAAGVDAGDPRTVVLDVRPPEHYDNGHIKGSLHIPLTQLIGRMKEIPKDKKIAVVCAMDTNSAFAVAVLRMHGYDAWIVEGGVPGWVMLGRPLEK